MAVYKRTYHAYNGPLTPARGRFLVISRYCAREMFNSRIFAGAVVFSYLPFLIFGGLIYVLNSPIAQAALRIQGAPPFAIDNQFFMKFLQGMGYFALFLCAYAAPGLVSMDMANNALPLYLSRPLNRIEYVVGKAAPIVAVLSAVTWVPGVILYLIQASMAGGGWGWKHLDIVGAILAGSALWIAFLTLISLAVSSWVRWRIIATAAIVAFFFVPAAFGTAVTLILRTPWGELLNFPYLNTLIWYRLFGLEAPYWSRFPNVPLPAAWLTFLGLSVLALWMLHERIRAREVVRG